MVFLLTARFIVLSLLMINCLSHYFLQSPLMSIMLASGEIYQLINVASFSRWIFIAMVTLGLLIHRCRYPDHPRAFKVQSCDKQWIYGLFMSTIMVFK